MNIIKKEIGGNLHHNQRDNQKGEKKGSGHEKADAERETRMKIK